MRTHAAEEKIVTHNYNKMYGVRHRYNVPVLFTSPSALGDIHAGSIIGPLELLFQLCLRGTNF